MGICNLDQNKELAKSLATYLNIKIKESLKNKKPFKLISVINNVYDIAFKKDQDVNKALGIAGALPKLFLELLKKKPEYLIELAEVGVQIDPIIAFNKEIKDSDKPLEIISKYIKGVSTPNVAKIIKNNVSTKPSYQIIKESKNIPAYSDKKLLGDSFKTTTGLSSIKRKDGTYQTDMYDPLKIASYTALQNLLMIPGDHISFENVTYDNHTGFRLRVVTENSIPEKSIYTEKKESKSLVVAITNNEGDYLYFNNNGRLTTEENGKVAYFPLKTTTDDNIKEMVESSLEKEAANLMEDVQGDQEEFNIRQIAQKKAFTKQFVKQAQLINNIKIKVNNNEKVLLEITGGNVGHIDKEGTKNNLAEFNLTPKEISSIGIVNAEYKKNNITYTVPGIQFDNYNKVVSLKGLSVKTATPDLFKNLVDLLIDDLTKTDDSLVTPEEKIELFNQYIYLDNKILFAEKDKLNIFINNKLISLENKQEAKKELSNFLEKVAYHTYIKNNLEGYKSFSINNNVLTTKEESSYIEFISQYLIPRIGMDVSTKRPMVNNGYFTFEETDLKEVVFKQVNKIVKEAKEEIKKSKYDIDDLANALERSKIIESRATSKQKIKADKWIKEASLLKVKVDGKPIITVEDCRNIVNSDAFATFTRATMTLYKGGDSTHLYHESWHAFSQIFLKKDERDALYKAASKIDKSFTYIQKLSGNSKKITVNLNTLNPNKPTDRKILEEFIAEEFRIFAINDGKFITEVPNGFKSIFKKIWTLLKSLFKGSNSIDVYSTSGSSVFSEMFNALYNAKTDLDLNMFQPAIQNAEFGMLKSGSIKKLSEIDMDLISKSIDGIISQVTTDLIVNKGKLGAAMQIFGSTKALDFLYNVSVKTALSNRLEEMLDEKQANEDKWNTIQLNHHLNNIDILQTALDNFGDIKNILETKTSDDSITSYHLKNSAFSNRIKEAIQEPTDISETNVNDILSRNDKQANSVQSEKLATTSTIYILQSLIQQEYNQNKTRISDKLNKLGFPQTIEFKPFWNFLIKKAGGQQNDIDLYNKLQEIKEKKITPLIQQLLDKIGDPTVVMSANKISADVWLGLVRSMNLINIDLHNNIFENTKDQDDQDVLSVISGKVTSDYNNMKNNIWKNKFNLDTSPFVNINENKQNELNLEVIGKTFLTSSSNYKEGILDRNLILRYKLKKEQDPIAFLNAVGLYMSNDYEIRDAIRPEAIDYIADAIGQAWFNKLSIEDPIKFFSTPQIINVQKLVDSNLKVVSQIENKQFKTENNSALINELAAIEAEHSMDYGSQMKPLPSGNIKSIYSLNSTTTRIVSAINHAINIDDLDNIDSNYGIVPQYNYNRNPTIIGSIFKNSLFDKAGNKIKNKTLILGELVGSQYKSIDGSTEGLSYNEMTEDEKFISDLHSMLSSGFMEAIRSGEKSTYYALRPNKIITLTGYNKKSDHLFFDTEHFLKDNKGNSITGVGIDNYLLEVMYKKLEGELRRIQKINNGITEAEAQALGLDPKTAKNFYKNNVKGFENGGKFDWFEDILETKDGVLKNTLINIFANQLDTKNDLKYLLSQDVNGKNLKKEIDNAILTFFKNIANQFKVQNYDKIYKNSIPDFLKNLVTKNLTDVQKSKVSDELAAEALMMSFAVNSSLLTDEVILTVFGDGFQFNHKKDEATKRIPTYNSPGIVFSTSVNSIAAINKFYPREYEAKLIADGIITNRKTPRNFDKVGQKAIIKDSIVSAAKASEYEKLFRTVLSTRNYTSEEVDDLVKNIMDSWLNIKDADGQGHITFDYYRMLKANENNWTNAQENIYQKEVKGEYISAEEISDAFPVYKLQYSGPLAITGSVYPIQSIDKFSLLPLIPSLIKDTPLDTIHKQMISQGIDYVLFDSGAKRSYIKAGKSNGDILFENNDTSNLISDFQFTKNPFYVDFLKNQTEVNREAKGKSRLSTQFRKLYDVGLDEQGVPIDYTGTKENWKSLSNSEKENSKIYKKNKAVQNSLKRLTSYMRKDLLTELGWEEKNGKLVGDMETMLSYIKNKLKEQGYSKHEIQVFETRNGKIDLSTVPIAQRLERFLLSIINNKLVKIKIKGESFVQVSGAFFQKFKKPSKEELKLYDDFGTNGIRGYVVDPKGKENTKGVRVKIALTENYENLYNTKYFIKNKESKFVDSGKTVGVYKKENDKIVLDHEASFKRLNEMIKLDEWLNIDNNRKKIQITGVRIPVQSPNSTEFAEIWEFLPPSAGTIIIIPAEIVAKSGGDFDVDKLTMYIKYIASTGDLLEDTYNTPDSITSKIDELKEKIANFKASNLNIKNYLSDFRKSIINIQEYAEISKEQLKAFTNKNDKELLKTLSIKDNQELLKIVAKNAYDIYNKNIKSFIINDYDDVNNSINNLFNTKSELSTIYKELTNLQEHKRNFTDIIQNSLIDNIIQVLQMPEMAFSLLLPNGTYLTKPYADDLQGILRKVNNEVDYTKSIQTNDKIIGIPDGVNSTVLRNYNYNLKKQQDNITGKRILGPIVLEIPVNNLLNKAGTLLEPEVKETIKIKNTPTEVTTPITLELKHNTVNTIKGIETIKQILMSNLLDADKKNQIADILSQLANGAVDVGKDAWIAYLQGNLEAIPKILFLLETGVPIEEIVYFVNNPLIREYIKVKQRANSKLSKIFFGSKHSSYKMIKGFVNEKLINLKQLDSDALFNINTLWGKYNLLKSFINSTKVEAFDKKVLIDVAKGKGTDDQNLAGFLQYLYVEQLTSYHDKLKSAIDVDNNVTGDNAEIQSKIEEISKAEELPIYNPSTLKYLKEESIISSFFIQELSADLFGERFFSLRANVNLDKFIRDTQNNFQLMSTLKKVTGLTKENFAPKFKNALMLHILTNALNEFDSTSKFYKGESISNLLKESPIKSIGQAIEDFKNKNYLYNNKSDQGYFQRGLYPINELYTIGYTTDDFVKLTLEREFLRKNIIPLTDVFKESIEFQNSKKEFQKNAIKIIQNMDEKQVDNLVYESMLLHQALLNTYNNYEMFSSGEHTVAKKLINIIKNYPDLSYKYGTFLERFTLDALKTFDGTNPRRNFKLKANSDISKPEAEYYHTVWKELADPNEHKLSGVTEKDMATNKYISDFFNQLPIFAFLQSGMDPSKFSMNAILPTDSFKPIMDQASIDFKNKVLDNKNVINKVMTKFFNLFLVNNSLEISNLKGRGLNYKSDLYKDIVTEPVKKQSEQDISKLEVNTKIITNLIKQSVESSEPVVQKARLINDADLASYKMYLEKSKGVVPQKFFTSNTAFKIFYDNNTGYRGKAPQASMWLLNNKTNLYDLVDQTSGEIYLENVSLETGYQQILDEPFLDTTLVPIINDSSEIVKIYNELGNKTQSENVVIKSVYQQEGVQYSKSINGIFSLRVNNSEKHFGNPFSSVPTQIAKGLIPTKSTKESVEKYIDWVINSKEKRAEWIREQLKSGKLKSKSIVYYKELGEPSHATALDYLINKYDWSKKVENKTDNRIYNKKNIVIKSIQDAIKDYKLDEILAGKEGAYDVQDFISNLEAATTETEINNIINKLLKLIC